MKKCDKRNSHINSELHLICKVKWSRYRPGVAQRVGRGIALLFHDRGTRRGWVVSSTHRQHFSPRKDPVPVLQAAEWAPGPVWTGGKSRPHRDSIPDRPALSSVAIPTELPVPLIWSLCLLITIDTLLLRSSFQFTTPLKKQSCDNS